MISLQERASTPPHLHASTPGLAARRLIFSAAVFLGLLFLLWLRFYQPPNTVDDAYITFRYARNLATGVGFVYNPGEPVLGTTTPAFAALLAMASRLMGFYDYPRLAVWLNALINALAFCVLIRLTARLTPRPLAPLGRWLGLGAALLLAIEGRGLDFSTGGMEAGLNQLAILSTFVLLFENHTRWAAVALGLALLVRPDGINLAAAFFAVLGLEALRRRPFDWRRLPWVEAGIFLLVIAPWVIFATLYFGNFIPQSILAKSELYRTPALMAFRAFLVQLRALLPFGVPPLQANQSLARELAQAVLPAALVGLGLVAATRRQPRAWGIGLYILLFITFYALGNPLWLGWYEIPLFPIYFCLIVIGATWVGMQWLAVSGQWSGGKGRNLTPRPPSRRYAYTEGGDRVGRESLAPPFSPASGGRRGDEGGNLLPALLATLAVFALALPHLSRLNVLPWETPQRSAWVLNTAFNKRREADYHLLAKMLQPAARAGRLVAIPEIGAFGYTYGGRLFDTSGLISPRTNDYFPIPAEVPFEIYAVPRALVFDIQPDVLISFDSMLVGDLRPDDPEFLRAFPPTVALTSHAAFGVQRLVAYRRADLPVEVTLPPEATPLEVTFGGAEGARLAGYQASAWAEPGQPFLELTLFWQAGQQPPPVDLLARVDLLTADGQLAFQVLDYPGEGLFPVASWTSGMWLVDRYQLKRPLPEAGPYTVAVTVFRSDSDFPLPAAGPGGERLAADTVQLGPITPVE